MIDLGMYYPGDKEHLARAMAIIEILDSYERPLTVPQGSPLDDLASVFQNPPLDLRATVIRSLDTVLDSLGQIRRYLTGETVTTPILLGVVMRSALLASSRVIFMLDPSGVECRRRNSLAVLRQESDSLQKFYKHAQSLKAASGLIPPKAILDDQLTRIVAVRSATEYVSESLMLDRMVDVIVKVLRTSKYAEMLPKEEGMGILKEQVLLAFHSYSGITHGYSWPLLVPRTDSNLPYTFVGDVFMIASLGQTALELLVSPQDGSMIRRRE